MIHVLAFMQTILGRAYPLFFSVGFAGLATYYSCFYESPDKLALTMLSIAACVGWLFLHEAERVLGRLIEVMERTATALQTILNETPEEE